MTVPNWFELIVLALAAYRTFRLIGEDTILDRPRAWLVRLHEYPDAGYREGLALWLQCPWCAGFWNAIVWFGLWQIWPHATLVAGALFAISTLVGTLGHLLETPDD